MPTREQKLEYLKGYAKRPDVRERKKAYNRNYRLRPGVLEREKVRKSTPEYKEQNRLRALKNYRITGVRERQKLLSNLPHRKFNRYKHDAKKRGYNFDITLEVFTGLINLPCHYCGREGGGIDRKDNLKGYVEDNALPSCKDCNHAKATLSYEEFIALCTRIATKH